MLGLSIFFATRIRINVSWSGSGSGQMIRIQPDPDPDPKHWFILSWNEYNFMFFFEPIRHGAVFVEQEQEISQNKIFNQNLRKKIHTTWT